VETAGRLDASKTAPPQRLDGRADRHVDRSPAGRERSLGCALEIALATSLG
jgi:hypothetical protein